MIIRKGKKVISHLSINTRSSFKREHLELGHITLTRLPAFRCSSWWRAWASWFTVYEKMEITFPVCQDPLTPLYSLQGCSLPTWDKDKVQIIFSLQNFPYKTFLNVLAKRQLLGGVYERFFLSGKVTEELWGSLWFCQFYKAQNFLSHCSLLSLTNATYHLIHKIIHFMIPILQLASFLTSYI